MDDQREKHVLVVDDNPEIVESLDSFFSLFGLVVHAAANGEQAIEETARWTPQLIVMDLSMPVMDGFEAARRIRKTERGARLPMVAISSFSKRIAGPEAKDAGFDQFIQKPADFDELKQMLVDYGLVDATAGPTLPTLN